MYCDGRGLGGCETDSGDATNGDCKPADEYTDTSGFRVDTGLVVLSFNFCRFSGDSSSDGGAGRLGVVDIGGGTICRGRRVGATVAAAAAAVAAVGVEGADDDDAAAAAALLLP